MANPQAVEKEVFSILKIPLFRQFGAPKMVLLFF